MMGALRPVGVFDSGLGGLTALREIRDVLPNEKIVYFGDTGRVPYGTRSHETICKYAMQDMRFLLAEADVKAVAVACGTVSANALDMLSEAFSVPVVGVIHPAAQAAAGATKNGRIGIIATPSTIASGAYEGALRAIDPHLSLYSAACALFVPLVENGFTDPLDPIPLAVAERYLAPLRASDIDTLILGCTHYPLLAPVIARTLPSVTLIDSGACVAHALKDLLTEGDLRAPAHTVGDAAYYVSDRPQGFARAAADFLRLPPDAPLPEVTHIDIDRY